MQAQVLCFALISVTAVGADPTVSTPLGNVHGTVDVSLGVPVEVFLGIPFAKPPVADRRFARPEPFGEFDELHATAYRPVCVQSIVDYGMNSSEDCLYLNVFRRQGPAYAAADLPVIVMIHGGAFAFGGAQQFSYSGLPLAAYSEIVVVTIQYRLGILGFAQSDTIPANLGLLDQRLAIKWVHDNIASFGGSPNKVTLMGVSAGSMSVSAHVMLPTNENYFQSVIMDAGVMSGVVVPVADTIKRMQKISALLRCPLSGEAALQCLRNADVQELIRLSHKSPEAKTTFVPTDHEDDWSPKTRGSEGFVKVRMLIGTAKDEGQLFVAKRIGSSPVKSGEEFVTLCNKLCKDLEIKVDVQSSNTSRLLKESYFEKHQNVRNAASEFVGDSAFVCPVNDFIEAYSKVSEQVFVYRFDRKLAQEYRNLNLDPDEGATHWTPHVHFSGSLLTLGPFLHPSDEKFSLESMEVVKAFVGGESPTFRGVAWPLFPKTGEILVIDETPSTQLGLHNLEKCQQLFPPNLMETRTLPKEEL